MAILRPFKRCQNTYYISFFIFSVGKDTTESDGAASSTSCDDTNLVESSKIDDIPDPDSGKDFFF